MKPKNIVIAGGAGFLGRALQSYFSGMGFPVRILTRNPKQPGDIHWDGQDLGDWISEIEWADVLINLAGKSVDCRYTDKNRKLILNSRINSTAILAKAVKQADKKPDLWLNSSSATTYVHSETQPMTEDQGIIGDDFSMNVCKAWEKEFFRHDLESTRRVAMRTAIVLGDSGGAYPKLKKIARLFMGGPQGNGKQFVSWIHILDFCKAVDHIIHHPELVGPVNIASPQPVRNSDFMKYLRERLGKSFGIGQPKWFLELGARIIGTETELLLKSRNVIPELLLESGFSFEYPKIQLALKKL